MSQKAFAYLTVFCTGVAVMIIEILGAKLLAPSFGSSHFVWTAQIAVTLVALTTGYYLGGHLADKSQNSRVLYWAIGAAAVYLAFTSMVIVPVSFWCLHFRLAVGVLLTSMTLFFIPLSLLAMTCPFLTRLLTTDVRTAGETIGRLAALGTAGSLVGTILIGYVLLPFFSNTTILLTTATCLLVLSFAASKSRSWLFTSAVLLTWIFSIYQPPTAFLHEFSGNSNFGSLNVLRSKVSGVRYYLNDNLIQNTYDPKTKQSTVSFTYMLSRLTTGYRSNLTDVLCIGLGVGIVPMDVARRGSQVDVVEINPAIVPVATQFFDFDSSKVKLAIDDGRHYLNTTQKQYDAIILDAFLGESTPTHLMTCEAFTSMRSHLKNNGVLAINSFCNVTNGSFIAKALNETLRAVFPEVHSYSMGDATFFLAINGHSLSPNFDTQDIHPAVFKTVLEGLKSECYIPPGRLLTDNFNPVEFYDAAAREDFRRRLAMNAQKL